MTIKKGFMHDVPAYLPVSLDAEPRKAMAGQPMGVVLGLGTSVEIDEEAALFADVPTVYTSTIEEESELAIVSLSKNPLENIRFKITQLIKDKKITATTVRMAKELKDTYDKSLFG